MILATLLFISYTHADGKAAAAILTAEAQAAGCKVWTDDQLKAGQNWTRQIEKAIDRADVVAVIVSPAAHASRYVRNEVLRALRKDKRIVPVANGGDMPLPIEHLQTVRPIMAAEAIGCGRARLVGRPCGQLVRFGSSLPAALPWIARQRRRRRQQLAPEDLH